MRLNLPAHCLTQAFAGSEAADVVLGPCDDGGYYLIGLKRPAPRLWRALDLREMTFGCPTEMLVKAARGRARLAEVPVSFRPRYAGKSKISGTVLAGWYILSTTLRYARGQAALCTTRRAGNPHPKPRRTQSRLV